MQPAAPFGLIIVGGGLAAALIVHRLARLTTKPILILEASDLPFGEHTWSFHHADVSSEDHRWLAPMVAHRWSGQSVRFADYERHLTSGYATLTSQSVRAAVAQLTNVTLRAGAPVAETLADHVVLASGEQIFADCIIDASGFRRHPALALGFQKFVGLEVETKRPHGLKNPIIMDASVDQQDGYRFVYSLPFSPTRLLIEDTRYADGDGLDEAELERQIHAYAEEQGWLIDSIVRRESGVLPIALAFDAERFWADAPKAIPQAGMRAALFHPTTGYSLPEAVRVANLIGENWPLASAALARKIETHAKTRAKDQRFYRLLDRMLFLAADPDKRHKVLQRFYRLRQPLIERFYAGETTWVDMARILIGKPPVPIHRALPCLREKPFLTSEPK